MSEKVNPQIVDATTATNYGVISQAGYLSQGVAYEAAAHSLSMVMQNAAQNQFGAKKISNAAVAKTCADILGLASE